MVERSEVRSLIRRSGRVLGQRALFDQRGEGADYLRHARQWLFMGDLDGALRATENALSVVYMVAVPNDGTFVIEDGLRPWQQPRKFLP